MDDDWDYVSPGEPYQSSVVRQTHFSFTSKSERIDWSCNVDFVFQDRTKFGKAELDDIKTIVFHITDANTEDL